MGGKGSGVSTKRSHLPRRYSEGALARLDRRFRQPKQMFAAIAQMTQDQGDESLSFVKLRLIQRTAHLDALLIQQETLLMKGEAVNIAQYLANAQLYLRYATTLGLERRAKTVRSLREYLLESRGQGADGANQEPTP